MKKVLLVYTTNSGSSEEVAQAIGEELRKDGAQVDVHRLETVNSVEGYDAVVVGAPMILGWHRAALGFVRRHREALSRVKVAYFFTAISLTQTGETAVDGVPVWVDKGLAQPPEKPGRLNFKENYATVTNYLRPALKAAPRVHPVSAAFFGGKLEYYRMNFFQMVFVMLIIQARPGDKRNWDAIREWASGLRAELVG